MEFIGTVCICVYGVEESKLLTKELESLVLGLIYNAPHDPRATRVLNMIQEQV